MSITTRNEKFPIQQIHQLLFDWMRTTTILRKVINSRQPNSLVRRSAGLCFSKNSLSLKLVGYAVVYTSVHRSKSVITQHTTRTLCFDVDGNPTFNQSLHHNTQIIIHKILSQTLTQMQIGSCTINDTTSLTLLPIVRVSLNSFRWSGEMYCSNVLLISSPAAPATFSAPAAFDALRPTSSTFSMSKPVPSNPAIMSFGLSEKNESPAVELLSKRQNGSLVELMA